MVLKQINCVLLDSLDHKFVLESDKTIAALNQVYKCLDFFTYSVLMSHFRVKFRSCFPPPLYSV